LVIKVGRRNIIYENIKIKINIILIIDKSKL